MYSIKIQTPIGEMIAVTSNKTLYLLDFTDKKNIQKLITKLEKFSGQKITNNENALLINLKTELQEYFEKKRKNFTIPTEPFGTEFQSKVWQSLTRIPFGEKQSYKQQSTMLNLPKSVRAVASANGKNPISILIPCHRVIGSNGSLTGYAGGIWRKEFLLNLEQNYNE